MLANVTVSNLNDVVNGTVTSIAALVASNGGDGISLREAILATNADNTDPADAISFAPSVTGTIQLTEDALIHAGEIVINNNVTISGPGAGALSIRGVTGSLATGDGARIFNITDGASSVKTVTITGLTLTGGDSTGNGGAIFSAESLTLSGVVVTGNSAARGGGIYSPELVPLTVIGSTVRENNAYARNFSLSDGGGGIWAEIVTITQSTISDNYTNNRGGGIYARVRATVQQSTVSGNIAGNVDELGSFRDYSGGAGIAANSQLYIYQSTITNNHANGFFAGGGIAHSTVIRGSIVAGNTSQGGFVPSDFYSPSQAISVSHTLIGANEVESLADSPTPDANGNLISSYVDDNSIIINAMLSPLAANGGPTWTHALLPGSPAIDRGDPLFDPADPDGDPMTNDAMPYDQRGMAYVRVADGEGAGGARVDMGAFEVQAMAPTGNFDSDDDVDGFDFLTWQRGFGLSGAPATRANGNADGDGDVDGVDLGVWKSQFGASAAVAASAAALTTGNHFSPIEGRESGELKEQRADAVFASVDISGLFADAERPGRWKGRFWRR